MQSRNPVMGRNEGFATAGQYAAFDSATNARQLEDMYVAPPAGPLQTGRMTLDDVVVKTGIMFVGVLAGAAVGWQLPGLLFVGLIGGLVFGLWAAFKREPSPVLYLAYAVFQGLFVGGVSLWYQRAYGDGIVQQAVLATLAVFAVALVAYATRLVKVTPRLTKMVIFATMGYALFALLNFVFAMFGFGDGWGFRTGTLGLLISLFAVGLAAFNLVLDFDFAEQGVRNGLPAKYAWMAAFGLTVTLVWLYLELLRLIAITRE